MFHIPMIYGYARVSTDGQSTEAQEAELTAAGCEKVRAETASGAKSNRAVLKDLLGKLKQGDTLMVTRLDRLARSTLDLLNILAQVSQAQAKFRSLHDPWADSATPHGKLMVTVLGGLAEFERSLILARTREGRARAKKNGKSLGRPFKLTTFQQDEIRRRRGQGRGLGESCREIAKTYAVSEATIWRLGYEKSTGNNSGSAG